MGKHALHDNYALGVVEASPSDPIGYPHLLNCQITRLLSLIMRLPRQS
jgi:hypothetical protein